ncbi:MAG: hypothetical protein FH748_04765 [Balneolaceae bacterium]|nr:hypothetical protein [Balneolaceae bacterium]
MNFFKHISLLLFTVILFTGCDSSLDGELNKNQLPTTNLTVERINRGDDFRLSSQIEISWWGNDPDGYIVGYEYAINDTSEGNWTFTEKSDSLFILPITEGQSEDEVLFKVRSVDNDGAKDPVGASLVYPIVNTKPEVQINRNESPPDTLFSISSFGWEIEDKDGLGNIDRTEIALNDTLNGWVSIPLPEEDETQLFVSLAVDNTQPGIQTAQVFQGRAYNRAVDKDGNPVEVPGMEVGARNIFYVRVVDAAGAVSNVDTLSWFVKQQQSDVLFINDDGGINSLPNQQAHLNLLAELGIHPDVWMINGGEVEQQKIALSEAFPAVIDPTLKKTLAKWDHIYWISDNIDRNITYALDITSDFFNNGGSMFVNIPMKGISQEDEIFNFLPVDSIGVLEGIQTNFLVNGNVDVNPVDVSTDVVLKTESRSTGVFPLKPISGATLLYETDFKATTIIGVNQDYQGFEGVGIENPEGDLAYFGMDLVNLNGNNNLAELIEFVCRQRLGF